MLERCSRFCVTECINNQVCSIFCAVCVRVFACEVLAATWQTGQGGAARLLFIIVGGVV